MVIQPKKKEILTSKSSLVQMDNKAKHFTFDSGSNINSAKRQQAIEFLKTNLGK